MRHRILIVDDIHSALMEGFHQLNIDFDYRPDITRADVLNQLASYTGLVVRSKIQIDREILDAGSSLLFVARAGAGMDNIDLVATKEKGIRCINAPEGNRDAVAEMAMGLLLDLCRNIGKSDAEIRSGKWDREGNRGYELSELCIGIIGFGNTGSQFAKRLMSFDSNVIYFDKNPNIIPTYGAEPALFEQVLKQADVLSFHVPLEGGNEHLIDKQLLESLAKPIFLLNTARGGIMKTQDVLWGLEQGIILGVGLDVLENEKIAQLNTEEKDRFERLKAHPKVRFTPHVAGWTFSSYKKIAEVLLSKISAMLSEDEI
ncbi:MAG: phosphoglycerate dehydrogenase [Bacteroidetes bacterium]|nr:MAG: phosphoglycerate dehydrogenase [Bacteroidota bacterium]